MTNNEWLTNIAEDWKSGDSACDPDVIICPRCLTRYIRGLEPADGCPTCPAGEDGGP